MVVTQAGKWTSRTEHSEAVYAVMGRIVEEGRGYWEWAGARQFA
jgi:hypothetical protein